jgi:hypothetical protein
MPYKVAHTTSRPPRCSHTLLLCLLVLILLCGPACNLHFDVDSVPRPTDSPWPDGGFEPIEDCDALGLTLCQNRCRSLQSDPYFCGSCTTRCAATETCDNGLCVATACPFDGGPIPGPCDPVTGQGCDAEHQACIVTFLPSTGRFGTICESRSALSPETPIGTACTSVTDCAPGSSCVVWDPPDPRRRVCSRLCRMADGQGCDEDEFCVNPHLKQPNDQGDLVDVLTALGYCTRRCSPTNLNACPPGQACAPDQGFGTYACHANFRCLENGGTSAKGPFSPCDRSELGRNGCPSGLICMPGIGGDQCLRPCVSDLECSRGQCSSAPEPWTFLSVCQL